MAVKEFYDVETTSIHIEMDVPLLKVWCNRLPDSHLRMEFLYLTPGSIPYSFAMCLRGNKKQFKIPFATINPDDHASDRLSIRYNAICLSFGYRLFNR